MLGPLINDPPQVTVTFVSPTSLSAAKQAADPLLVVLHNGVPQSVDKQAIAQLLSHDGIAIRIELQDEPASLGFWTCELG